MKNPKTAIIIVSRLNLDLAELVLKKIGKLHAWDQQMHVTQWKYMKGPNAR